MDRTPIPGRIGDDITEATPTPYQLALARAYLLAPLASPDESDIMRMLEHQCAVDGLTEWHLLHKAAHQFDADALFLG